MQKESSDILSPNELMYLLIGIMLGLGIFSLPNDVTKVARQDGWISAFIAVVYPLYVTYIASFVSKKYPDINILSISKKYLGFLGVFLNAIFMLMFLFFAFTVSSGMSNVIRIYGVPFMSSMKVCAVAVAVAGYSAYKGLKTLGKINSYIFYLSVSLLLLSASAFKVGSFLNVRPVFGAGIGKILLGTKETIFAYISFEILLLIYPQVKDKKQIKKAGVRASIITAVLYSWAVFITIYYLGIDIIPKNFWSLVMVTESVQIPIINNFRFIFMFLWLIVIFKVIANEYFAVSFILNDITGIDRRLLCLFLYPLIVYLALLYPNEIVRRAYLGKIVPYLLLFNLFYMTLIAIIVAIDSGRKKRNANE